MFKIRHKKGTGCPFCSGRCASSANSLRAWCGENGELGQTILAEWDVEDYVVVCMALWGCNWTETLSEATRVLGYRGRLLLAEGVKKGLCTPGKITVEELRDKITELGLTVTRCEEDRGFVFIEADK